MLSTLIAFSRSMASLPDWWHRPFILCTDRRLRPNCHQTGKTACSHGVHSATAARSPRRELRMRCERAWQLTRALGGGGIHWEMPPYKAPQAPRTMSPPLPPSGLCSGAPASTTATTTDLWYLIAAAQTSPSNRETRHQSRAWKFPLAEPICHIFFFLV